MIMKKRIVCFAMAMLFIMFASGAVVIAAAEGSNNGAGGLDMSELGPDTSIQFMFAKLQLEMAEIAKNQAMESMAQISAIQEEQRQVSGFLNIARQCGEEAASAGAAMEMPSDMAEYMQANNLSYGGNRLMTSDEWDAVVSSLESRMAELGMNTQQMMVYVQDFMGQYNSYLQGVNLQTNNAAQTISGLARGQSMYGDSEAGLAVTSLVVGLVLGCVITLAAQKFHRKKDAA